MRSTSGREWRLSMGHNSWGTEYTFTTFGESHGEAVGVVIDGAEPGFPLDLAQLQREMDRRRPGGNRLGTARSEKDAVRILSGLFEGKTTGAPIAIVIANTDTHPRDYEALRDVYRPGHADYTYEKKYGIRDHRGGGRSSARETACRVAAGAVAKQMLRRRGITVQAGVVQIGSVSAAKRDWNAAGGNLLSCPDSEAAEKMQELIEEARRQGDSRGGVIECIVRGCPPGLGDPEYDRLDARLASALFSINAAKGVEVGEGFASALLRGSEDNDQMDRNGFLSNHCGGILGGISTGQDIVLRVAFKATPSISVKQKTIDKTGREVDLVIGGRHDPCVCPRAVPVVEAMAAATLLDAWYAQWGRGK